METRKRIAALHGRWRQVREVLRDSLVNFLRENSFTVSASIAYYSLLALFPLLLLLLGVSGIFIRRYELSGRLAVVLEHYLPVRRDFIMRELGRHFASLWKGQHPVILASVVGLFRRLSSP